MSSYSTVRMRGRAFSAVAVSKTVGYELGFRRNKGWSSTLLGDLLKPSILIGTVVGVGGDIRKPAVLA